ESLARAGRRRDERVAALADPWPSLALRKCRLAQAVCKPLLYRRMESAEGGHRKMSGPILTGVGGRLSPPSQTEKGARPPPPEKKEDRSRNGNADGGSRFGAPHHIEEIPAQIDDEKADGEPISPTTAFPESESRQGAEQANGSQERDRASSHRGK